MTTTLLKLQLRTVALAQHNVSCNPHLLFLSLRAPSVRDKESTCRAKRLREPRAPWRSVTQRSFTHTACERVSEYLLWFHQQCFNAEVSWPTTVARGLSLLPNAPFCYMTHRLLRSVEAAYEGRLPQQSPL